MFNYNIWNYNRWHDTQDNPSYIGILSGTQQRTITLTHNIINPFTSTILLILREYGKSVVVLPYKYDGKEGNTDILEAVPYEYYNIIEAVLSEEEEGAKKVIIEMDEEALPLEEGGKR